MYRDDRQALTNEVDGLRHDIGRVERENVAMRSALLVNRQPMPIRGKEFYASGGYYLQPGERAALAYHTLKHFPVWAVAVLHLITFGLFSLIHFGMVHDQLPKPATDDPTAGKAIGFMFIPYWNWYWVFMHSLRLADRVNFQFALRGLAPAVPRGLVLASSILFIIPYVNILIGMPIMWLITSIYFQAAINRLVELGPGLPAQALPPAPEAYPQAHPQADPYAPPQDPYQGWQPPQ